MAKVKTIDETIVKKHSELETIVSNLYKTDQLPEDIDEKEVIALQESISDLYIKIHSNCALLTPIVDPRLVKHFQFSSSGYYFSKVTTLSLGTFQVNLING